jgi:predicted nucleotidyltransferase
MEFQRYSVDRTELERWLARIARELERVSGLVAAVLYGSAAEGLPFRDLDIALIVDREVCPEEKDWDLENALADCLAPLVPVPVDVHVVNDAPLALRYNVTQGHPFWVSNPERYADFVEQSWDLYFDFAPVSRKYLEEMMEW